MTQFAGEYCQPAYGRAVVTVAGTNQLHIHLNILDLNVVPSGDSQFFIPGAFSAIKYVNFSGNGALKDGFTWALEKDGAQPLEFKRCAPGT